MWALAIIAIIGFGLINIGVFSGLGAFGELTMTIGWAIIIVFVVHLLGKHGNREMDSD